MPFDDLLLLTCDNQRYLLKAAELDKCFQDDTTILCPENILHTVQQPTWLGLPWTPNSKLAFKQLHRVLTPCRHTPLMLLLGGRYYLSTAFQNLILYSHTTTIQLSLSPLSIIHVPCNSSFQYQKGGLGKCPQTLRFSIPVFQNSHFTYVPWTTAQTHTVNISAPNIPIPEDLNIDNSTFVSLDNTYDLVDRTVIQRLTKLKDDINQLQPTVSPTVNDIFTYLTFALTIMNFLAFLFLFGRIRRAHHPLQLPTVSLSARETTTDE